MINLSVEQQKIEILGLAFANVQKQGAYRNERLRFLEMAREELSAKVVTDPQLGLEEKTAEEMLRSLEVQVRIREKLTRGGWVFFPDYQTANVVFYRSIRGDRVRMIGFDEERIVNEAEAWKKVVKAKLDLSPSGAKLVSLDEARILEFDHIAGDMLDEAIRLGMRLREGALDRLESELRSLQMASGLKFSQLSSRQTLLLADDWKSKRAGDVIILDWSDAIMADKRGINRRPADGIRSEIITHEVRKHFAGR